jgi:hypothetical protein
LSSFFIVAVVILNLLLCPQDIHSDRSPFLREPGLDQPQEPEKPASAQRSSSEPLSSTLGGMAQGGVAQGGVAQGAVTGLPQRPKKLHPIEDTYGLASDKYIKRFPHATSYKDYRDYKDDYGYGYRYNNYHSYRADTPYGGYSAAPAPFVSTT